MFLGLPSEILLKIATYICLDDDLCYLVRACRLTFKLLNLELYKRSCRRGNFAMLWAAKTGSTGTVKQALRVGADSNMKASGLHKIVRDISLHRRSPSPTFGLIQTCHSMPGKTPLVLAAENGHKDVVRLLVQDAMVITSGMDIFRGAVRNGHAQTVKLLLSCDIILSSLNSQQYTTLIHLAASKDHAGVVSVLLSRTDFKASAADSSGLTALHLAAKGGHMRTVKLLLNNEDVGVNVKDGRGNTPLHVAIRGYHMPIVKAIIDHNHTNVNIEDRHGLHSLHLIARMGGARCST